MESVFSWIHQFIQPSVMFLCSTQALAGLTYGGIGAVEGLVVAVPAHVVVPAAVQVQQAGVEAGPRSLLHLPLQHTSAHIQVILPQAHKSPDLP